MGKKGDLYLGLAGSEELLSPYGRTYTEEIEEFAREDRTASGKLVKDIIAKKRKFTLDYGTITGDALEAFLDLYDLDQELSFTVYHTDDGSTTTTTVAPGQNYDLYTVLMQPFSMSRLLLQDDGLYTGVTIILNEV